MNPSSPKTPARLQQPLNDALPPDGQAVTGAAELSDRQLDTVAGGTGYQEDPTGMPVFEPLPNVEKPRSVKIKP